MNFKKNWKGLYYLRWGMGGGLLAIILTILLLIIDSDSLLNIAVYPSFLFCKQSLSLREAGGIAFCAIYIFFISNSIMGTIAGMIIGVIRRK